MRLHELNAPDDFWDDARHAWTPQVAAMIEREFIGKTFPDEKTARTHILRTLKAAHTSSLFNDTTNEVALAQAAPVYFDGKAFRIGTKNVQPTLTWNEIRIKPESREEIGISAEANAVDFEITWKPQHFQLVRLLPDLAEDSYMAEKKERAYITKLAEKIRENRWFTPIFVGQQEDDNEREVQWIVEGQHRARAVFYDLRLPTIPGYLFDIFD